MLDLFQGIAAAINGIIAQRKLNEWAKLLFSIHFSGVTSFCFACGSALVAHRAWPEAVGLGLVSAAVMMTVVFRRSPLTKGLFVALPAQEAGKELEADIQTIQRQ